MIVLKTAKIASGLLFIAGMIALAFVFDAPESSSTVQSTDDAYVHADFTLVSAKVSGTLDVLMIEENQPVRKGELLAIIDDRDFVVAVDAAKAGVASVYATIEGLREQLALRRTTLREIEAVDQSKLQSANRDTHLARVQTARQQMMILKAELDQARALLARAQAVEAAAQLQLSYTRITAPISGVIGQKSINLGTFVDVGKPLLAIVPLDASYVVANFRETQLAKVRVSQPVDIRVDALPGQIFKGVVQSLGPASSVSYLAVAPQNSIRRFEKSIPRLPVRIRILPGQPAARLLRVGMSVRPRIDTELLPDEMPSRSITPSRGY